MINLEVGGEIPQNEIDWEDWEKLALKMAMLFWEIEKEKVFLFKKFVNTNKELVWIIVCRQKCSFETKMILAVAENGDCKVEFTLESKEKHT